MILPEGLKKLEEYSIYEKKFEEFYQAHKKIVIFGTGKPSSIFTEYLNERKLNFEFYCVTKRRTLPIPSVKEFDEIKDEIDSSYGIAVAMSNGRIAVEHMRSRNVVDNVFYCPEFLMYCKLLKAREASEKVAFENHSIKSIGDYRLREDTFYIVCPEHIGETSYALSLVNAFKKEKNVGRVCAIVKKAHGGIPDLFHSVDEKLVSDELVEICEGFSILNEIWKCRNYLFANYHQEYGNMHVTSIFKSIMCIDESSELEKIGCARNELSEDHWQSVILMPHAHAVPRLSVSFWEKLAKIFVKNGYEVYTNVVDETEYVIEGTRAASESLVDMAAFAERCSLVIGLRSGLCDLLALTKANMVVIDTSENLHKQFNLDVISASTYSVLCDPESDIDETIEMVLRNAKLLLPGIADMQIT